MFGLFKKKDSGLTITDKVWIKTEFKWQACLQMAQQDHQIIFVAWFDETLQTLTKLLADAGHTNNVVLYRHTRADQAKHYVFAEHYPLISKERDLYSSLGLSQVVVLNALDEPLLEMFGGANIALLLEKLGMKEDEEIEHAMVSKSIKRALERVSEKVLLDQYASNQGEWLKKANVQS